MVLVKTRVYAKIACESRQEARRSDNNTAKWYEERLPNWFKRNMPYLYMSSTGQRVVGLTLYHEIAASNALFWDAAGNVCRQSDNGYQMMYYELAIRHTV